MVDHDNSSQSTVLVAVIAIIAIAAVSFLILSNRAGPALPGSVTPSATDNGGAIGSAEVQVNP